LLAIGGATKLASPHLSSKAWEKLHFPSSTRLVQVIGLCEFSSGLLAIVFAGKIFPLVIATWFFIFSIVTWYIIRLPEPMPCGCLGKTDAPTSLSHFLMNVALTITCLASVGVESLPDQVSSRGWTGLIYLLGTVTGSIVVYAVLSYNLTLSVRFRSSR